MITKFLYDRINAIYLELLLRGPIHSSRPVDSHYCPDIRRFELKNVVLNKSNRRRNQIGRRR